MIRLVKLNTCLLFYFYNPFVLLTILKFDCLKKTILLRNNLKNFKSETVESLSNFISYQLFFKKIRLKIKKIMKAVLFDFILGFE